MGHRSWLSPPDPSTNQNTACSTQHEGTATWFFEGSIFMEWKSKSSTSLLWIHGKRVSLCSCAFSQILTAMNGCSGFREEHPLVSDRWSFNPEGLDLRCQLAPESSKISWRCGRPAWPPWRTSISTFGTPTNKTFTMRLLPFLSSSPLVLSNVATYCPAFTRHMMVEYVSLARAR